MKNPPLLSTELHEVAMFLLVSSSKKTAQNAISAKVVKNFKQIFLPPKLTEEERWALYYDYSSLSSQQESAQSK